MNGEIDLELYTISLIGLNNTLENLDDSKDSLKEIADSFKEFYEDVLNFPVV